MPTVFIPEVGCRYRLVEEWSPLLDWDERNLVLFKNLKYTGTKRINLGKQMKFDYSEGKPIKNEDGSFAYEDRYMNKTIRNPLYQDNDGKTIPVIVHFPEDTVFDLAEYKMYNRSPIRRVWLKVVSCSDKRYVGRGVSVAPSEFFGANIELVDAV